MGLANLGSIATWILQELDNVPVSISGDPLLRIIDRRRLFIEQWTGQTIGSTHIAEKYQPALVDLSKASVLARMQEDGADVKSIALGDLKVDKGQSSNLSEAALKYEKDGMEALKAIGRKMRFKRVL